MYQPSSSKMRTQPEWLFRRARLKTDLIGLSSIPPNWILLVKADEIPAVGLNDIVEHELHALPFDDDLWVRKRGEFGFHLIGYVAFDLQVEAAIQTEIWDPHALPSFLARLPQSPALPPV